MLSNVFRTFLSAEFMRGEELYLESRRGCCQEIFFSKNVKPGKKRIFGQRVIKSVSNDSSHEDTVGLAKNTCEEYGLCKRMRLRFV